MPGSDSEIEYEDPQHSPEQGTVRICIENRIHQRLALARAEVSGGVWVSKPNALCSEEIVHLRRTENGILSACAEYTGDDLRFCFRVRYGGPSLGFACDA